MKELLSFDNLVEEVKDPRKEDTQPFRRETIDQIIHGLIEHDAAECAEKFRLSTTPPPPPAD